MWFTASGSPRVGRFATLLLFALLLTFSLLTEAQSGDRSEGTDLFRKAGVFAAERRLLAPNFTLPGLDGKVVSLKSHRGNLVFLNFWATWCPPCRVEMPSMDELYNDYRDRGLSMLAVSVDVKGERVVRPFMEELKLSFPALLDTRLKAAKEYKVRVIPSTYLIDMDGYILGMAVGPRDWASAESRALIEHLLASEKR